MSKNMMGRRKEETLVATDLSPFFFFVVAMALALAGGGGLRIPALLFAFLYLRQPHYFLLSCGL
ncbi:MAG: hypothetical protein KC736_00260 [Candidatus Moranbacteria bacterium]|nr:hypothetical protein [Candidatus Moranbacteria bacterium]